MSIEPSNTASPDAYRSARVLTYLLFFIFALTTDAVGVVIPEVVKEFDLSLTQAGSFHYATMLAIALSGAFLGSLADTYGRRFALLFGMGLFAASCIAFVTGRQFLFLLALIFLMGVSIGVFKTAALALVGDASADQTAHTHTMNMAEGFFGLGAIVGPAIVTVMLANGIHWTNLYVIAGGLCLLVMLYASRLTFPSYKPKVSNSASFRKLWAFSKDPYAMGFALAIMLYVVAEAAIYVWMPTYLASYDGSFQLLAAYALTLFFCLRAGGRFLGAWILKRTSWKAALTIATGLVAACYAGAVVLGVQYAIFLLPLSGLFMSLIYPTLNSKGISCFDAHDHGSVAGFLLFFTAVAAAGGPLIMALIGDVFGDMKYGFIFSLGCAVALFGMAAANQLTKATSGRLG